MKRNDGAFIGVMSGKKRKHIRISVGGDFNQSDLNQSEKEYRDLAVALAEDIDSQHFTIYFEKETPALGTVNQFNGEIPFSKLDASTDYEDLVIDPNVIYVALFDKSIPSTFGDNGFQNDYFRNKVEIIKEVPGPSTTVSSVATESSNGGLGIGIAVALGGTLMLAAASKHR